MPVVWDDVEEHIREIAHLNLDRFTPDDLYAELLGRRMQLWCVRRGRKIVMVGITAIRIFPRGKVAYVIGVSGSEMEHWLHFQPDLLKWAKGEGCQAVDAVVRKGWTRLLKDWKPIGEVISRSVGD